MQHWRIEMNESNRTLLIRRARLAVGLAFTFVMLAACASTPPAPPTEYLATARQAIVSAEQADAQQFAGAELDEARQRLTRAERAVRVENMILAEQLAQESRVSAELALAQTESAKAADINREMRLGAEALRDEMQRTGDQQ